MARRRAELAVDRMTVPALWSAVFWRAYALDPLHETYIPGQTHGLALEMIKALRELELRGVQLTLHLSEPDDGADKVA